MRWLGRTFYGARTPTLGDPLPISAPKPPKKAENPFIRAYTGVLAPQPSGYLVSVAGHQFWEWRRPNLLGHLQRFRQSAPPGPQTKAAAPTSIRAREAVTPECRWPDERSGPSGVLARAGHRQRRPRLESPPRAPPSEWLHQSALPLVQLRLHDVHDGQGGSWNRWNASESDFLQGVLGIGRPERTRSRAPRRDRGSGWWWRARSACRGMA